MIGQVKSRRLESGGWRVGDAADFLDLTPQEAAFVKLKLALAHYLRQLRAEQGRTQLQVAGLLGSNQSRDARMEAADPSVSVDLLVRSLLSLGASRADVGRVIAAAA